MTMKAISQKDAAVLALVVENPRMDEERYAALTALVQDVAVRQLVELYRADQRGESLNGPADRFGRELEAMRAWAAANAGRRNAEEEDGRASGSDGLALPSVPAFQRMPR